MKKIIFGLIIGLLIAGTSGVVLAWDDKQKAQPIYGASCDASADGHSCNISVYVFDDAGNKCYLAESVTRNGIPPVAISCVKAQP